MAVYKATFCYPYLNQIDMRITQRKITDVPADYISCKIDTSNTQVTGYSIRVYDESQNVVFPNGTPQISPISELQDLDISTKDDINSGWNGTMLKIPFFQNAYSKKLPSVNAIYYNARCSVDHVIMDTIIGASVGYQVNFGPTSTDKRKFANLANWIVTDEGNLEFNWPIDSETDLPIVEDNVILDGEVLIKGDIVMVMKGTEGTEVPDPNNKKMGLWTVAERYEESIKKRVIALKPYYGLDEVSNTGKHSNLLNNNDNAVVIKGKFFHNKVFKFLFRRVPKGSPPKLQDMMSYEVVESHTLWQDQSGNILPKFLTESSQFTWEITLYQGNGIVNEATPKTITYGSIDKKYLDIFITSGTILGSTPERIQIASREPAFGQNDSEEVYLPKAETTDIVLQDKYIDLGQYEDNVFTSNVRANIKTYDASYGHVYPATSDILDLNVVHLSTHCQFFEHSSNPEEILDGDIVRWGVDTEINFHMDSSLPPSSQYIALDDEQVMPSGRTLAEEFPFEAGDLVLLTGQVVPYQNGVYEYYKSTNGKTIGEKTYYSFLKRAASYSSWASYIGKIIYCEHGSWGGQNVLSLAKGGTYTLWNPSNITSGSSALLFTAEKPILLFPQLIKRGAAFDSYCTMTEDDSPTPQDIAEVTTQSEYLLTISDSHFYSFADNTTPQVGDIVLFKASGCSGRITDITSGDNLNAISFKNTGFEALEVGDYISFTSGSKYGRQVFKWIEGGIPSTNPTPNWDLHTAVILKNNSTRTYISPFINVEKDMYLKLTQTNRVKFALAGSQTSELTEWIKITNYNDTIYYIDHATLSNTSPGVEVRADDSYGLVSYSSDKSYPWKYEIRSYFTKSNENLFYVCQTPYIILYKNGKPYTGLQVATEEDYQVLIDEAEMEFIQEMMEEDDEHQDFENFALTYYVDQDLVNGRAVRLSAEFVQFAQNSWESHRWLLLNSQGEIIQDTGDKYDKTMDVTFYGLANETIYTVPYYVVLMIADDLHNTSYTIIKLKVVNSNASALSVPFTAQLDCPTQSVLLMSHQDVAPMLPTYRVGDQYEVFDTVNKLPYLWDGSIAYTGEDYMQITAVDGKFSRSIDYYSNTAYLDNSDRKNLDLGKASIYGVMYAASLGRDITEKNFYETKNMQLNGSANGEFYFDTKVRLSDNYCGQILSVFVEEEANSASNNPFISLQEDQEDHSGYLEIGVTVPDNFTGAMEENKDILNEDRNTMCLFLKLPDRPCEWVTADEEIVSDDEVLTVKPIVKASANHIIFTVDSGGAAKMMLLPFSDVEENQYRWCTTIAENIDDDDIYYYLQPKEAVNTAMLNDGYGLFHEFLDISSFPLLNTTTEEKEYGNYHFFTYNNSNNQCLGFFGKFLGNSNIIRSGDTQEVVNSSILANTSVNPYKCSKGAPSYWVENRKYIKLINDCNKYFYRNTDMINVTGESENMAGNHIAQKTLRWPIASEESTSFWNESGTSIESDFGTLPAKWTQLTASSAGNIKEMVAIDRHPNTLSQREYRIQYKVYNIQKLYKLIEDEEIEEEDIVKNYDPIDQVYTIDITSTNSETGVVSILMTAKLFIITQ